MNDSNELLYKVREHLRDLEGHKVKWNRVGAVLGFSMATLATYRNRDEQTRNILESVCNFCVKYNLDLYDFLYTNR